MRKYLQNKSNYDKSPAIAINLADEQVWAGWEDVVSELIKKLATINKTQIVLVIECYHGVNYTELLSELKKGFEQAVFIDSSDFMLPADAINALLENDITDDAIFGYLTRYNIDCYFDRNITEQFEYQINSNQNELTIVYGVGAAYICSSYDLLVYADMARWEIQKRFRNNQISNIGVDNSEDRTALQYKRAFFVDWRICDRWKKKLMKSWDYVLDTNTIGKPTMVTAFALDLALQKTVQQPFRVVPFFDAGPWGGQWMKEVFDLDNELINYAWGFDCVPEENSLYLDINGIRVEIPSINLVFAYPKQLLGNAVYGRFGDEFPIRFDFLDTMQGGNLSLQVHPLTEYIQDKFGMHYTQDESYYILDADENADTVVYLGLKNNVDKNKMLEDLTNAQKSGIFKVEKYVGVYPVKKHDHVLIPAGTVHCSGANSIVLEISATPYIFTFKLWDWGRLDLDGRPRPINIEHGNNVIQWDRTETWVKNEIINRVEVLKDEPGNKEERTGLHQNEFIETRRNWFTTKVVHHTNGGVNVLNLVQGKEALIESPTGTFEPFVVHYAETFIVPAAVGEFTISPTTFSKDEICATIKAFVRTNT